MKTSKAVSFEEFNNYPETITKEQMFKLCHISKKKLSGCSEADSFPASIPVRKHGAI